MILRDEQVGRAIVVVVPGDDGARVFQLNLVQANIGGNVLEAVWPEIAEEPHFALAVFRLADRDEIDPTVVVIIDSGHAKGAEPIQLWKRNLIEVLAPLIAPK